MKIISRRTFLKSIGLITAALLIAPKYLLSKLKPKTFFVDSEKGKDYYSGTASHPFATINEALSKCIVNNGDVIYVFPNHTETNPSTSPN